MNDSQTPKNLIAQWRTLSPTDIPNLTHIASIIHPDLPERDAVFLERINFCPQGCLGLFNDSNKLCGYLISHPIRYQQPPDLDSFLGEIIAPDQYYIHDLAILPVFRGSGLAQEGVEKVLRTAAKAYETSCLVSVYGTARFWGRFGFEKPDVVDAKLGEKVRGYGDGATYLERKNG
jgi:ribosomal protein S18 acetylase RimI-like enzyme